MPGWWLGLTNRSPIIPVLWNLPLTEFNPGKKRAKAELFLPEPFAVFEADTARWPPIGT
jgi:hypothetical protein